MISNIAIIYSAVPICCMIQYTADLNELKNNPSSYIDKLTFRPTVFSNNVKTL